MIVADYIAQFLVKKNIKDVFFVEGSAVASLVVAVARNKHLKYYCPLHEQAGAFMVDGYFKASGRLSVMLATSGPGGQNLLNGIAASFYDSCPAIYITGQVNSRFIKPNDQVRQWGFQENDIVSMAKPITKYAVMITDARNIRYELEKAFYLAVSERPGPVLIDIPMDIQKTDIYVDNLKSFKPEKTKPFELYKVNKVVNWLQNAKRPAILLGGGVWLADAVEEAKKLAKELKYISFFVTWNMIDYYDPHFFAGKVGTFGGDGRNFGIQNCDLLLAIGSRISGRITGGRTDTFARGAKKIIVDIDEVELKHQQVMSDLNIYCDAKVFIETLRKRIPDVLMSIDQSWLGRAKEWMFKYSVLKHSYMRQRNVNPYVFIDKLSDMMSEGDILVHEAGGNCVVTSQGFKPKANQRVFSNNGNSSLGYALPAAIGAAIARKKQVICILGDGGMNFNIQELQTIKHYNLPIKVFIFNNKVFGITKAYRDTHFNSEYAGVDAKHGVSFPDFLKVAQAYDLATYKIDDQTFIESELKTILGLSYPIVCDVNMAGFYDYQPKLGWGAPIEMQYPFLPKKEFLENMIVKPVKNWEKISYPGVIK